MVTNKFYVQIIKVIVIGQFLYHGLFIHFRAAPAITFKPLLLYELRLRDILMKIKHKIRFQR